ADPGRFGIVYAQAAYCWILITGDATRAHAEGLRGVGGEHRGVRIEAIDEQPATLRGGAGEKGRRRGPVAQKSERAFDALCGSEADGVGRVQGSEGDRFNSASLT